ncbi:isoprenylcysteine carboxylmethyltransferase family protein [Corallincola holothuriorum]|uniref:Isoprenylcysteine carboxylmethyltransferase family protein n=1 Tax=Corallincola holothuriorum TaxID=2282215 RepID=A0A368NMZ9_9GAMM|nr:isoprenylcysteine carboxylmethyltransferase family protein [Corallincola holothuriorum]RCU51034.1 isoprenylcysteine carboxylmethyltransferase family protein [Corallincola holothuriorum]
MSYLTGLELKVPPIIVMLSTASFMFLAAKATGQLSYDVLEIKIAGWFCVLAGLIVIFRGVQVFRSHQTTIDPRTPDASSQLVTSGIYRFTRNPMYLGMALCLTGWGLYLGSFIALVLVYGFSTYITRFQILSEERLLKSKFGLMYLDYIRDVRRWL